MTQETTIKTNTGELAVETLTLERAKRLTSRDVIYDKHSRNKKGEHDRYRVMGMVKTWKRSPERVQVPIQWGMYAKSGASYVTEHNVHEFWIEVQS